MLGQVLFAPAREKPGGVVGESGEKWGKSVSRRSQTAQNRAFGRNLGLMLPFLPLLVAKNGLLWEKKGCLRGGDGLQESRSWGTENLNPIDPLDREGRASFYFPWIFHHFMPIAFAASKLGQRPGCTWARWSHGGTRYAFERRSTAGSVAEPTWALRGC